MKRIHRCIGGKKSHLYLSYLFETLFSFGEHCAIQMNALIKAYNVKNFVEFVVDFVYGILFSHWTQYKHGSFACAYGTRGAFFYFFSSSRENSSKKIVYRKRSTTYHIFLYAMDMNTWVFVCVCVFALGTFILHITSTKNILVLLLRKLNEWCVCELVFFCFSFSLCVHLLNSMTSNCFLYFLYCIYRTEVCAARLTWLTERV